MWLTQQQLCELYQTSKSNVSEHIKHIFEDGELDENVVVRKFRTTTQHRVTCRKFRQVQQHPFARRRGIFGDYQISRTTNEEVQITYARCSDTRTTPPLHVTYPQQGNQAGDTGSEMAVGTRIPVQTQRQKRARQAAHRHAQIQDSYLCKRLFLARA